jgi:hypothetical protein
LDTGAGAAGALPVTSNVDWMREPDTRFLNCSLNDQGIRDNIGGVARHLRRRLVTGRALLNAVFRLRLFRDYQSNGFELERARSPSHRSPGVQGGRRSPALAVCDHF